MNNFDEKFSQKVKEVFDSYNADHLVDTGWRTFQKKQGGKKRFSIILPFWAKAATLTILIALGSFVTIKLTKHVDEYSVPLVEIEKVKEETTSLAIDKKVSTVLLAKEDDNSLKRQTVTKRKPQSTITYDQISETIIDDSESTHTIQKDIDNENDTTYQTKEHIAYNDESKKEEPSIIDDEEPVGDVIAESLKVQPSLAHNILDFENTASTRSRISLGAGFSGMIAIAEDMISTSPGVAIGLYAQHKIADGIFIQPGLALAKHTYSLENLSNSMDYATPTFQNLSGQVYSYETTMDIIAVEIPINFVFDIVKRRHSSIFVSAGASTLVYLNQSYSGTYRNIYVEEVYNSETHEIFEITRYSTDRLEREYGALSHTDFFGLANLAMGYSFPLGKNSMLIEPFVQIPMGEITSIDLRMGFGGVSLKYIFLR
jgi:hypothetical protein